MQAHRSAVRITLGLFLMLPLLSFLGVIPEPSADMYSPDGWSFIAALKETGYMMPLITFTSVLCGVLFIINYTALGAVLLAPFTVNVILFHVFLDASPISASAIPAYILLLFNLHFLRINWQKYSPMW